MYPNYQWDSPEEEGRYSYGQPTQEAQIPFMPGVEPTPPPDFYHLDNLPPAPPAGFTYMRNPNTGAFELVANGQMPPWGAIANPPQDPSRPAGPLPPQNQTTLPPPVQTTYGGDNRNGYSMGGGSFDPSGFSWPQFSGPTFSAPKAFEFEKFAAPDPQGIFSDPSYKMRRDEGLQAIEHGAAAKGLSRLPATLKSLGAWNQDFASREYGNIFDRSAQTYDRNRNNAADTYSLNYGISRDVFDRDYQGARDQFQFNQFEPAKLNFEDMYRRWRDELDSTTSIATAGAGY